jgi:prolyl oligopeptidase
MTSSPRDDDPYLWLEEIDGTSALDFVRAENARTLASLAASEDFTRIRAEVREVLDSPQRIAMVEDWSGQLYNFWQDRDHPRGLWRRTSWAEYKKAEPAWTVVLDLDTLALAEAENWVWKGAQCLPPGDRRCLVALSRGGGDAVVIREFDLGSCDFVRDGFVIVEAKTEVVWRDLDTLYVASDFGPGTLTDSGYARTVRRWSRGSPLSGAPTVFEGERSDVGVGAWVEHDPQSFSEGFVRSIAFYCGETWCVADGMPERRVRLEVPLDAEASIVGRWLVVRPRTAWEAGKTSHVAGSLIAIDAASFIAGAREFSTLFAPTPRTALESWVATRSGIVIHMLDNVRSRVLRLSHAPTGWVRDEIDLPGAGTATVAAVDRHRCDDVWISYQDFLTPVTLGLASPGAPIDIIKSMPPLSPAEGMVIEQLEAGSADGTRVPYFVVARSDATSRSRGPTLLYGYGGFEISLQPSYNPALGRAWLARGGRYVMANIRGGGEFGPRWHQAALKSNRQRAYDDFIAVADDLVRRGLTTPANLGMLGGSNGGLLIGAVLTQRPELFGAAVIQVPLLDMRRYSILLAGASWMAEYGNPEVPEDWKFISRYSPYQNVSQDRRYPPVLFITSTRDDRVHPGHARKMFAKMKAQGHAVWYYENIEGGHAGAADNAQRAQMVAVQYAFLWRTLNPQ